MREKIAEVLRLIFGYGVTICLFVGGLTFFGYVAALIIGGDVAAKICSVIYDGVFPYLILLSTIMVLVGLVKMYLSHELALTAGKRKERLNEDD